MGSGGVWIPLQAQCADSKAGPSAGGAELGVQLGGASVHIEVSGACTTAWLLLNRFRLGIGWFQAPFQQSGKFWVGDGLGNVGCLVAGHCQPCRDSQHLSSADCSFREKCPPRRRTEVCWEVKAQLTCADSVTSAAPDGRPVGCDPVLGVHPEVIPGQRRRAAGERSRSRAALGTRGRPLLHRLALAQATHLGSRSCGYCARACPPRGWLLGLQSAGGLCAALARMSSNSAGQVPGGSYRAPAPRQQPDGPGGDRDVRGARELSQDPLFSAVSASRRGGARAGPELRRPRVLGRARTARARALLEPPLGQEPASFSLRGQRRTRPVAVAWALAGRPPCLVHPGGSRAPALLPSSPLGLAPPSQPAPGSRAAAVRGSRALRLLCARRLGRIPGLGKGTSA